MRHAAALSKIEFAGRQGRARRLPPIIAAAMAAILVLAGSLIVATERAGAQSNTTLVSNLDKHRPGSQIAGTASSFNFNDEVAAAFTTGTNDYGYGLASVTVELASSIVHAGTPVPEFTIRSDRNGSPGPVLFTLDNPSNIGSINTTSSRFTFNAPSRTELAPNTTYWLVAYATDAVLLNGYTEILDEDAGKKPGWSIGDAVFSRDRDSNSAWDSNVTRTLKMGLRGVVFGPDVGQLALYWLDQSGQQDHPEANGNLLQLQYCRGTLPFMVYFHGNMDHRDIDEWDVDIRPWRGVVGDVTYGFREQTDANDGFHQMFGRVTFDGPTSMTIKIRARDGNTWGPWSPPYGLYCREVPRVATITTSGGQIINEGDSFTFDVVFDKPMQLDTDLNVRLTRSEGSYPKFMGGIGEKTITVRRGQSEVSLDMRSIDDDIWSPDRDITLEIVPGTGYRAGHRNAVSFQILDGSYVPELDADGNPTGSTVFDGEADTVTRTFPRCGESSKSTATNRVGLMEVREDAGTIQVPVHTIAGGTDFAHSYVILDYERTATRAHDYSAAGTVRFQPLAETALFDVRIFNNVQIEDTENFRMKLFLNALSDERHLFDCEDVEIIIEDDDTADTTIRIADGANTAFTDFVNREARVTEGSTIKLEVSLPAETGNCIAPFRLNAWTTASGDVSVIDQSGFTTTTPGVGTHSGLSIPPCTSADEMEVPTTATAGDQGTKTVHFDIAPFEHERVFLEGGRQTVRYTVHIDDSEASSQQVEADETVDNNPPQLQSATVDGSNLTLAYDEPLHVTATPPLSAFTVNVGGSPRPVMVVAVVQSSVLLHLSEPVEAGEVVTVDYTVPTDEEAGRVQDTSGNAAESFSGQAVTNDTTSSGGGGGERSDEPDPPGVPESLDVALQQSGKLKATWKAPGSGPAPTGYTVQWKAAVDAWEDSSEVSETDVTKTSYVIGGLTDGVEYTARVVATRDGADSAPSEEVTATPQETTPPELSSAGVDGAGLTLTFNEALDTGETPDKSVFAVTVAGSSRGVDAVSVSDSEVSLTLVTAVSAGDAVTVDYTAPAGESESRLQDQVGNAADSFSGQSVTNDTPAAAQLTASAHDVPAAHDGGTTFTFELRFSEEPADGFSYTILRDHAFTVTGGEVVKVRRLEKGKNVRWEISVTPNDDGPVTVVLPVTTDCAAPGAVCTGDGRPLSGRLELTVSGPGEAREPPPNSQATGKPEITGTAREGETLTASRTGISDVDGLDNAAFSYQWVADGSDIPGATGSTYTLVSADVGKAIRVRAGFTDDAGNDETLTSAATDAVAAKPNNPATGAPAINGIVRVGETLTASTTGVADEDGLDNVTFSYQWIANDGSADADISGATDSTYTLTFADVDKTIKVRMSFTDDAGHEETLTSAATGAVMPRPPLTAGFESAPSSHDGQNAFTFELRFSEEPADGFSYQTLRDHAFTATGGEVVKVRRLEKGKNVRWEIHVTPDGDGTVTVVLPVTTDCTATGAVCTGDGRMLSNRLEITVPGPGG